MILAGDVFHSTRRQLAPGVTAGGNTGLSSRTCRAHCRMAAAAGQEAAPNRRAPSACASPAGLLGSRCHMPGAPLRHLHRLAPCRATLDTPEIAVLVDKMLATRPPPGDREKLSKCLALIEEINSKDPSTVEYGGRRQPYRVLFGSWLAGWVEKLDPGAPDELYILARGKNIESWRLVEIKRDDYSPNTAGQKQWEADRKMWLASRLKGVVKEAGYGEASQKLVEDFMLNRDLPDPRDVRLYDVSGPMGTINYRLLELLLMVQTLRDAEALVFLEQTFPRMFAELPADEVLAAVKREFAGVSKKCLATVLQLPWSPLEKKLLTRALPAPPTWGTYLRGLEGVAAASTHPGDWRYKDFDYE